MKYIFLSPNRGKVIGFCLLALTGLIFTEFSTYQALENKKMKIVQPNEKHTGHSVRQEKL